MNKDQVKGRVKKVTGKIKEVAGKTVGNKELESRGKGELAEGKIQTGYGDVIEDISDLKKDIKKSV